jgi:hypothetical protein
MPTNVLNTAVSLAWGELIETTSASAFDPAEFSFMQVRMRGHLRSVAIVLRAPRKRSEV